MKDDWKYYDELQRPILDLSPYKKANGAICNLFLKAAEEDGRGDSEQVALLVCLKLKEHIARDREMNAKHGWWGPPKEWELWLCEAIQNNREAATSLGEWAVQWSFLPREHRDQIKKQKSWGRLSEEEKQEIIHKKQTKKGIVGWSDIGRSKEK